MSAQLKSVTKSDDDAVSIEKGIPVPKMHRKRKWPWLEMEVGDSFLMPDKSVSDASSQVAYASGKHQRKYVARTVDGGVRVWRVE